ncbi:amidase family protein, partial [uncultured Enorma sp.]|uniref:amidase family protein n=1 Tax=uncultured Enorma sp. TaxID=1714346 RepID=UPI0025F014DD
KGDLSHGAALLRRQMLGAYLLSSGVYDKYYYAAQKARTLITEDYARAFEQADVLLMPAAPQTAFRHGEISDPTQMYLSDMYTISINIAGNGGVTVPVGLGEDSGLPIGAQLVAPAFADERLVTFGAALERACAEAWGACRTDDAATAAGAPVAPAFAGKGGELA